MCLTRERRGGARGGGPGTFAAQPLLQLHKPAAVHTALMRSRTLALASHSTTSRRTLSRRTTARLSSSRTAKAASSTTLTVRARTPSHASICITLRSMHALCRQGVPRLHSRHRGERAWPQRRGLAGCREGAGGQAVPCEQLVPDGTGRVAREDAGGDVLRGPRLLLQLGHRGERGSHQVCAQVAGSAARARLFCWYD
jgi:hypothetical protein